MRPKWPSKTLPKDLEIKVPGHFDFWLQRETYLGAILALSWPHLELILALSWPQLGPILGLLAPSWLQFGPILGLLPFSWPQLDRMPEGIYFPWALVARNMVPRHSPGRPPAGIL